MTDKEIVYLDYIDAVDLHFALMKTWCEIRFGVENRDLIESALARPKHAAIYENADIIRQAATLVLGLIKNHPWEGGQQTHRDIFGKPVLKRNGWKLETTIP